MNNVQDLLHSSEREMDRLEQERNQLRNKFQGELRRAEDKITQFVSELENIRSSANSSEKVKKGEDPYLFSPY